MTESKEKNTLARRDLFRAAGVGAGALGAVAIGMAGTTPPAKAETTGSGARYHETDHVRRVYELSRF